MEKENCEEMQPVTEQSSQVPPGCRIKHFCHIFNSNQQNRTHLVSVNAATDPTMPVCVSLCVSLCVFQCVCVF